MKKFISRHKGLLAFFVAAAMAISPAMLPSANDNIIAGNVNSVISSIGIPSAHATGGSFGLTSGARQSLLSGAIKSGDTFKYMLFTGTNNVTSASTSCTALTGEVGTSNTGYTTGGITAAVTLTGTTSVTWSQADATWTAGTSNLTARVVVDCDTTANLVLAFGNLDSGAADVTTNSGQTYTVHQDATHPVFTFA